MTKLSHYNVLLVEDERLLMQSLSRHIDALDAGFKVAAQASNGAEALKRLKSDNIHLVMTDIRMPVMDGLTLAKKIHEQYPHSYTDRIC